MKIPQEALEVLDQCRIEGNTLFLPDTQLDRKLYQQVNKVLTILGGKWNRKAKGHVFLEDPTDALDAVMATGDILDPKKVFQFFETPPDVVDKVMTLADIKFSMKVLEPSAGKGTLALATVKAGATVVCVELNPDMSQTLCKSDQYLDVLTRDFLSMEDWPIFDRVIMNPPFSQLQDIDHVINAQRFIKTGGKLVAIMSEGAFFRTTRKAVAFREWLETHDAVVETLPEGAFKASGTMVRTRIVSIDF